MDDMTMTTKPFLRHFVAPAVALLALGLLGATAARATNSHTLPLWKVSDSQGHSMYLAGSMHALTQEDYPLPAAFKTVFDRADTLIEEINLTALSPSDVKKAIQSFAILPEDTTLAQVMGEDWIRAQKLASKVGVDLEPFKHFKPWFAAIRIASKQFSNSGYKPMLGLDYHFSGLAKESGMPIIGLETIGKQLSFFNSLKPETQRKFLLQTLEGLSKFKKELAVLHAAWRVGDLGKLDAIAQKNFSKYPQLRKQLLKKRNQRWLPTIKDCLRDNHTCLVVVGAEHMAGEHGLVASLGKAGYRIEQLSTTDTLRAAAAATASGE